MTNNLNEFSENSNKQSIEKFMEFLADNSDGILFKHLHDYNEVISQIIENLEEFWSEYKEGLIVFFQKARKGFIKEKSFDDKLNFTEMVSFLKNIIKLIKKLNPLQIENECQKALIEINYFSLDFFLHYMTSKELMKVDIKIYTQELKNKNKIEFLATKRTKNKRQCEEINIKNDLDNKENDIFKNQNSSSQNTLSLQVFQQADILSDIIEFIQKYHSVYEDFTILLLEILNRVYYNIQICQKLCQMGFLKDLLYIIYDNKANFKKYISRLCFEILWNCIHLLSKEAIQTIESEDTLFIIKEILCSVIQDGYKMEEKTTRNELLVLINYMLDSKTVLKAAFKNEKSEILENILDFSFKTHNFENYYLLEILLYIGTIDEILEQNKNKKTDARKFFELGNEDLICKKLVIHAITLAIKNSESEILEKLIKSSYFIDTLFFYFQLYNGENLNFNTRYSIPQIKEIQTECLYALEIVASKYDEFFYQDERIVLFLKYLRNSKDNQKIYSILKVFERLSIKSVENKNKIVQKGTIDLLLYYINGCERMKNLEEEEILKIKTSSFNILANLCEDSQINQQIFTQKGGIDTLLVNLKNTLIMKTERCSLYTINIFKAIRCCVLGNKKNKEVFLENEGFYILLEFLESCLQIHFKQILSTISSLLENSNALRYFDDWTSSTNSFNTSQLLIQIYIEQDKKFKVEYKKGIIVNTNKPLNPQQESTNFKNSKAFGILKKALQNSNKQKDLEAFFSNLNQENFNFETFLVHFLKETICEFDLRSSIYCIFQQAGFERHQINLEELQRMEIIKNFKQLRIGEIWTEIRESLEQLKIEPTEEDKNLIMSMMEEMKELLDNCLKNQNYIENERKMAQEEDLTNFFDMIKNYKKQFKLIYLIMNEEEQNLNDNYFKDKKIKKRTTSCGSICIRCKKFWKPILQWSWRPRPRLEIYILIFLLIGILFLILGIIILAQSSNLKEFNQRYDNDSKCQIGSTCTLEISLPKMSQPIYLYYNIREFYQNHRRYFKSIIFKQTQGEYVSYKDVDDCEPFKTNAEMGKTTSVNGGILAQGDIAYPCGIAAKSYFTDTYTLKRLSDGQNIVISDKGLAWRTDRENDFKNYDLNKQWIDISQERFIVWMKIAPFQNFRKPWGVISENLPEGKYEITIVNNWPVEYFRGEK